MYLEQGNYNKETVVDQRKLMGDNATIRGGYPLFNNCDHTTLDMSKVGTETENGMQTLSIKLDDERYLTLSVISLIDGVINVDLKFHGSQQVNLIEFDGKHKIQDVGLLALISNKVEGK